MPVGSSVFADRKQLCIVVVCVCVCVAAAAFLLKGLLCLTNARFGLNIARGMFGIVMFLHCLSFLLTLVGRLQVSSN